MPKPASACAPHSPRSARTGTHRLSAARARLATRRRLAEQQRASVLLKAGWHALPGALVARWQDPAARATWVAGALASAGARLPRGEWRVTYASGLTEEERARCKAALAGEGVSVDFRENAALRAGVRVNAGANVIDSTLAGLMADRAEIGAQLLRALEAQAAP